jgi:hypothetical protein
MDELDEGLADWIERILERLSPAEVSVPRRYSIYTLPHTQFPRKCYSSHQDLRGVIAHFFGDDYNDLAC